MGATGAPKVVPPSFHGLKRVRGLLLERGCHVEDGLARSCARRSQSDGEIRCLRWLACQQQQQAYVVRVTIGLVSGRCESQCAAEDGGEQLKRIVHGVCSAILFFIPARVWSSYLVSFANFLGIEVRSNADGVCTWMGASEMAALVESCAGAVTARS